MTKFLSRGIVPLLVIVFLAGCEQNAQPKLGEQYQTLPNSLTEFELAPVSEVFSLTCGHCRTMEKSIPELQKLTGETFGKIHVTFNESAQISAIIYYTAVMQVGGVPDHAFMEDLFAAVQMSPDASPADRQQALDQAFSKRGFVSPYHLDDAQKEMLFEMVARAELISEQAQINSVPTFIVNGKYQIISAGHESAQQMADTITFLLTQP